MILDCCVLIKLRLCQERLATNWLDVLDTAVCLTGFIILRQGLTLARLASECPRTTLNFWSSFFPPPKYWDYRPTPTQSIYVMLGTKLRAWSITDKHSSNWATFPSLNILTVPCFISDTIQWFESNSSKINLCEVSIRKGYRFHDTQFSDPQKAVLLTLHDLLLFKEYYRNQNVTQWQSPCLVYTEPRTTIKQITKQYYKFKRKLLCIKLCQ